MRSRECTDGGEVDKRDKEEKEKMDEEKTMYLNFPFQELLGRNFLRKKM